MAWGLWNKIKSGLSKAGRFIKTAVKGVVDKVVKPFKPVISTVVGAINPTAGVIANTAMNAVEKLSDEGWGGVTKRAVGWANSNLNR